MPWCAKPVEALHPVPAPTRARRALALTWREIALLAAAAGGTAAAWALTWWCC
jgi:hypothetical protein